METKDKPIECTSQQERLSDLPVTQEQAADTKGGADDDSLSLNFQSIRSTYTPYREKH